MNQPRARRSRSVLPLLSVLIAGVLSACASVKFERDTATSGTFSSRGFAFTIASIDLPKPAIDIARENASDSGMQNLIVEKVTIIPNLGWFNWVLDIVGVRYARISGTWGFPGP